MLKMRPYAERMKDRIDARYEAGRISSKTAVILMKRAYKRYSRTVHCGCCGQCTVEYISPDWETKE